MGCGAVLPWFSYMSLSLQDGTDSPHPAVTCEVSWREITASSSTLTMPSKWPCVASNIQHIFVNKVFFNSVAYYPKWMSL